MWPTPPVGFLAPAGNRFRLILEAEPGSTHSFTLVDYTPASPTVSAEDTSACVSGSPRYEITLSWNNHPNVAEAGNWSVLIERHIWGSPDPWESVDTVPVSGAGAQTYKNGTGGLNPILPKGAYEYRLRYTDGALTLDPGGTSGKVQTYDACAAPVLTAADATGCLVETNTNVWQNVLTWNAPTAPWDTVRVESSPDRVSWGLVYEGANGSSGFYHVRSKAQETYYRAFFIDTATGNESGVDTTGKVQTWPLYPCPPDPPTGLTLVSVSACNPTTMTTTYRLRAEWTNATGIGGADLESTRIYVDGGEPIIVSPSVTEYEIPLPGSGSHTVEVRHYRDSQQSKVGAAVKSGAAGTACTPPANPSVTSVERTGSCIGGSVVYGDVEVEFTTPASSAHATWYTEVQRQDASTEPWTHLDDVPYPGNSYTDTGPVPPGAKYRVRMWNTSGYSALSSSASISVSGSCPLPPSLSVTDASTCNSGYRFRVRVTTAPPAGWALVVKEGSTVLYSGASTYDVYRSASAGAQRTYTAQFVRGSESSAIDSETEQLTSSPICPPSVNLVLTGEDTDSIFGYVTVSGPSANQVWVECDGDTINLPTTGDAFTFNSLSPGTQYTVTAYARNVAGTVSDSEVTTTDALPPPAPTNMNVSATVLSNTSVRFNFSASGVVDRFWYRIDKGSGYGAWQSTTGSTATVTVATCSTTRCEAYAINAGGRTPSAFAQAVTGGCAVPAPTNVSITALAASQTSISLSWSATGSNITYTVKRGSTVIYSGSGTSMTDTGLDCNTSYTYTVTASNPGGSGTPDSDSATTFACGGGA